MTHSIETFLPTTVAEPLDIVLPYGLIGLSDLREFELTPIEDSWPLLNFRSRNEEAIEFYAVEARNAVADYGVELSDEDAESLGLTSGDDAIILNFVTVHSYQPQYVTVNLAGPIIVNRRTLLGKQIVLPTERFSTTHPLVDERFKAFRPEAL